MGTVQQIRRVGVFYNPFLENHLANVPHIESPERSRKIFQLIKDLLADRVQIFISKRRSTVDELLLVHTKKYIESIFKFSNISDEVFLDPDTVLSIGSVDCALLSVGLVLESIDKVMDGTLENAFVISRPPGHHATADRAMGFCIFNNVSVGALYLLKKYGFSRIAIVDFDVHHGNGTQEIFYDSDNVLYISTHRYPFYPGSGYYNQIGIGNGIGFTVNIPLPGNCDDNDFAGVYSEIIEKVLEKFQPEFTLVSAGFDAYYQDPICGMNLTEISFRHIANIIFMSSNRVIFVLEGGYNPDGVSKCIYNVMEEILAPSERRVINYTRSNILDEVIENFDRYLDDYWNIL